LRCSPQDIKKKQPRIARRAQGGKKGIVREKEKSPKGETFSKPSVKRKVAFNVNEN